MHQDGMRTPGNSHPRDLSRPWSVWRSEIRNGTLGVPSVPLHVSDPQTGKGGGRSGGYEDGTKLTGNGGESVRGRGVRDLCPQIRRRVAGPTSGLAIPAGSVAGPRSYAAPRARPHAVPMRTRGRRGCRIFKQPTSLLCFRGGMPSDPGRSSLSPLRISDPQKDQGRKRSRGCEFARPHAEPTRTPARRAGLCRQVRTFFTKMLAPFGAILQRI